jgi:serine protease inhibitor ecotin
MTVKNAPKFAIALIAAACASTSAFASETSKAQPLEKVAPYPQAEKGMKRQVIQLPVQQDEANFKVELLIGRRWKWTATSIAWVVSWKAKPWKAGVTTTTSLIK